MTQKSIATSAAVTQIKSPPSLGVETSFSLCKELKIGVGVPSAAKVRADFRHILCL